MSKKIDRAIRKMFKTEIETILDIPKRLERVWTRAPEAFKHYGYDELEGASLETPATGVLWLSKCTRSSAIASLQLLLKCVSEANELSDAKKEDLTMISWNREGPTETALTASLYLGAPQAVGERKFVFRQSNREADLNNYGEKVKQYDVEFPAGAELSSSCGVLLGITPGTNEAALLMAL